LGPIVEKNKRKICKKTAGLGTDTLFQQRILLIMLLKNKEKPSVNNKNIGVIQWQDDASITGKNGSKNIYRVPMAKRTES